MYPGTSDMCSLFGGINFGAARGLFVRVLAQSAIVPWSNGAAALGGPEAPRASLIVVGLNDNRARCGGGGKMA